MQWPVICSWNQSNVMIPLAPASPYGQFINSHIGHWWPADNVANSNRNLTSPHIITPHAKLMLVEICCIFFGLDIISIGAGDRFSCQKWLISAQHAKIAIVMPNCVATAASVHTASFLSQFQPMDKKSLIKLSSKVAAMHFFPRGSIASCER